MIRVVNALEPLGKEKALAAIEEYLRRVDHHARQAGSFWSCGRCLKCRSSLAICRASTTRTRQTVGARRRETSPAISHRPRV